MILSAYLTRLRKVEDGTCQFRDSTEDDTYQTFFECDRSSNNIRRSGPDNIVQGMRTGNDHWQKIIMLVASVLKEKWTETQTIEAANRGSLQDTILM